MLVFYSVSLYYLIATLMISEYNQITVQSDADAINSLYKDVLQISRICFQKINALGVVNITPDEFSIYDGAST